MRWDDERYVRIYTRDTAEWLALSWEARGLLMELLRKADRAGFVQTGKLEAKGLAALARMPLDVVERALPELLEDGCLTRVEKGYLFGNFVAAQETRSNDAQRKRDQRERDRDVLAADGFRAGSATSGMMATHERKLASESPAVTADVTSGHQQSPADTAGHSVPCRTVPSRTVPRESAHAPDPGAFGLEVSAVAEGIRSVTGRPFAVPRGQVAQRWLEALDEHRPPGADRCSFARERGVSWAKSDPVSLAPFKFIDWLNDPRPAKARGKPSLVQQPPGPGDYDWKTKVPNAASF